MKSIQLTNVSTYYKNFFFRKTNVLKDINLKLQRGHIYGLLGPNGAGKTTLIKTLLGLLRKQDGTINHYRKGSKVNRIKWLEKVGYVPEEVNLTQNITAYAFLKSMGRLYPISKQDLTQRIEVLLQRLELEKAQKQKIKTYSKGMKKRLLIAQSLLCNPKMLFLDEPMAGLDPKQRNQIRNLFTQYKKDGTGILISSHELPEIQMICDTIFFIKDGQIILNENLNNLECLQEKSTVQLSINQVNDLPKEISKKYHCTEEDGSVAISIEQNKLHELLGILDNHKIIVKNIQKEHVSLEEVFLNNLN